MKKELSKEFLDLYGNLAGIGTKYGFEEKTDVDIDKVYPLYESMTKQFKDVLRDELEDKYNDAMCEIVGAVQDRLGIVSGDDLYFAIAISEAQDEMIEHLVDMLVWQFAYCREQNSEV